MNENDGCHDVRWLLKWIIANDYEWYIDGGPTLYILNYRRGAVSHGPTRLRLVPCHIAGGAGCAGASHGEIGETGLFRGLYIESLDTLAQLCVYVYV